MSPKTLIYPLMCSLIACTSADELFKNPDRIHYPETWFHLIGGNVSHEALSKDLEAVQSAGLSGIQLFHGRGNDWPDVETPIQTLSPEWDTLLGHIVDETQRLDLNFTMQNCPGWAMSGGPWITPENAMRHLVWSRTEVSGGTDEPHSLPLPSNIEEDWRNYQDISVIAFPTPKGDSNNKLKPISFRSNRPEIDWQLSIDQPLSEKKDVVIEPQDPPTWVEFNFAEEVTLRAIEFPPTDYFLMRQMFHPGVKIKVEALTSSGPKLVAYRDIPRGNWQDKDWDVRPISIALSDAKSSTYRVTFENKFQLSLRSIGFNTRASVNDWQGQAAFVLRSHDFSEHASQSAGAHIARDQILDLTNSFNDGELVWKAPAGRWTILRIGHVNTGVKNKPAPPEATGFECDKLSTRGADQHFPGYIGRVSAPGGPADGGRLKGMLIDSWECFTQTWTPSMAKDFSQRRGYDMKAYFPALLGYVVDDHETSERFLRDWRATISDLMVDNYFGRLAEHARERGMKLSFEAAAGDVAIGDILQYFSKADIPMTEYWALNDPHWGGFEAKPASPASSAAHIYGKTKVAAEAFTQYPLDWNTHPFDLKHLADRHYAAGVNHVIFHTYTHNPSLKLTPGTSFGSPIGSPFIRNQTWWQHMPHFTDYLARCNATLQRGQPIADVLWYLGDSVEHKPRQDSPFPEGYKFDYLNADALNNHIDVVDGKLHNKVGTEWKLIWLRPENCREITLENLQRIDALIEGGATVVGPAPMQRAGLTGGKNADKAFSDLVSKLWGNSGHGDRTIGEGRLIWGNGLQAALDTIGIAPDVKGTRNGNWIHRCEQNRDIYFVTAHRDAPLQANLDFRSTGSPEIWNPITGETRPLSVYTSQKGRTSLPIDLPVAGSAFIIFNHGEATPAFSKVEQNGVALLNPSDSNHLDTNPALHSRGLVPGDKRQPRFVSSLPILEETASKEFVAWESGAFTFSGPNKQKKTFQVELPAPLTLDGPWTLGFPTGWDLPKQMTLDELKPWTDLENPEIKAFSGTVSYQTQIELPAVKSNERALIELGQVGDIAKVVVNGHAVATLWAAPHRCDITTALQEGENQITIHVTNTWHNRLAYDAGRSDEDKKTWTIFPPKPDSELLPAGLLSDVSIHIGQVLAP